MTNEEIIKALECCIKPTSDCDNCPYYGYDDDLQCFDMSKRDALDLINRQQAEIDMLNAENTLAISERNAFQKSFYATVKENRQLKADLKEIGIEYERLDDEVTNGIEVCHECHEKYDKKIKQTKADAIKEFADRLHTEIYRVTGDIIQERNERLDEIESSNIVIPFDNVLCGYNSKLQAYDHINGFIHLQYKEMVGEGK